MEGEEIVVDVEKEHTGNYYKRTERDGLFMDEAETQENIEEALKKKYQMQALLELWGYFVADMRNTKLLIDGIKWRIPRYIIETIDILLRGCGQVVGMNNTITGLLIVAALFWNSWEVTIFGLVGVFFSTFTAIGLGANYDPIRNGIFGYNGLLVGLACGTFSNYYFPHDYILLVPAAFTSAFSTVFFSIFLNLFSSIFNFTIFFFNLNSIFLSNSI